MMKMIDAADVELRSSLNLLQEVRDKIAKRRDTNSVPKGLILQALDLIHNRLTEQDEAWMKCLSQTVSKFNEDNGPLFASLAHRVTLLEGQTHQPQKEEPSMNNPVIFNELAIVSNLTSVEDAEFASDLREALRLICSKVNTLTTKHEAQETRLLNVEESIATHPSHHILDRLERLESKSYELQQFMYNADPLPKTGKIVMDEDRALHWVDDGEIEKEEHPFLDVLNRYAEACHQASRAAGWWKQTQVDPQLPTKLLLIHEEVGEATAVLRKGNGPSDKLQGFSSLEEEMADILIRTFDFCGAKKLRIGEAVEAKMAYNKTRLDHTEAERNKPGGKAF